MAATITPTSRGADALACLYRAVAEAEHALTLDDLRVDRGTMDVVDDQDLVIGEVPAPIAVVTDKGRASAEPYSPTRSPATTRCFGTSALV